MNRIVLYIRLFLFRCWLLSIGMVVAGIVYLDSHIEIRKDKSDIVPVANAMEVEASEGDYMTFGKLTPSLVSHICETSEAHNINCVISLAVAQQETGGDPWLSSGVGAIGLMQVMPQTARLICKEVKKPQMLWDVRTNIECGVKVLDYCLRTYQGDVFKALYCYNGSPACQEKCRQDGKVTVCINPCRETFEYARNVVRRINNIRRER